jgi:hypothetical protein
MRIRFSFFAAPVFLLTPVISAAQASDPIAARGQLQQGFALKEQGKCNEAIPHFLESIRLDRQPKALLNLADCEEKTGKLGAAAMYFSEARDLAHSQGLELLRTGAEQRLQAIEKRLPKLVVKLAPDAPADTIVARDGVDLGSISLGSPLPIDVGRHTILARRGSSQRQYDVTIAEGETKEVIVTPMGGEGPTTVAPSATAPSTPAVPATSQALSLSPTADSQPKDRSAPNGQLIAGFSLMGIGAVGLAVGTIFGLKVSRKNDEIDSTCPTGQPCPPDSVVDYNNAVTDAKIARAVSLVGFGVGAVFVGTGVTLALTAPKRQVPVSSVRLAPTIGGAGAGAILSGAW